MFTSAQFYIIVCNNSFIIKKGDDYSEYIIHLQQFIPNIPYINNINNDMESFKVVGDLISLDNIIANIKG